MIPVASVIPQPEPVPLPAPLWVFWTLLMLTLTLHVLAMNLLVGGSALAAYVRLRHGASDRGRELLARLAAPMPSVVAATVTLGVAPLLFVQVLYGRLFFVSSVLMAWSWLAVVPAVAAVYAATYAIAIRAAHGRRAPAWLHVGIVALLGVVAFAYTTNMSLMLGADRFSALYAASGRGLHLNLTDPTMIPRWLHMVAGAIAVGALGAALLMSAGGSPAGAESREWARRLGARWSVAATAVNLAIGIWWTAALPTPILQTLAARPIAIVLFAVAILLGIATLTLLWSFARPAAPPRLGLLTAASTAATVVLMLFVRDQIRQAALDRVGFAPATWVITQWGPLALFVVLLLVALGVVGWMVAKLARGPAEVSQTQEFV